MQTTCEDNSQCGFMPLYRQVGKHVPARPAPGLFPWQVNLYANGKYICGGTLLQKYWVLTHKECANRLDLHFTFVVARAGQYRDAKHLDAYNQIRNVVHKAAVDGTNVVMLLVDKKFDLNEYVNLACLPSVMYVPIRSQCYITGKANFFLNYQFKTQV